MTTAQGGATPAPRASGAWGSGLLVLAAWGLFFALVSAQAAWRGTLSRLFPAVSTPVYEHGTLLALTGQHLALVGAAMGLVLVAGLGLGLAATRRWGLPFLPLVNNLTTVGQTFPPVAVLFLALPILGFGPRAAVLSLFAYALLPVTRGLILGLQSVPETVEDAARGLGLSDQQRLWRLEWPAALPSTLAGIRTALVLTVATATLAPLVGAGGLGVPIIAGLGSDNLALILQGALPVALLALLCDFSLRTLERALTPWASP